MNTLKSMLPYRAALRYEYYDIYTGFTDIEGNVIYLPMFSGSIAHALDDEKKYYSYANLVITSEKIIGVDDNFDWYTFHYVGEGWIEGKIKNKNVLIFGDTEEKSSFKYDEIYPFHEGYALVFIKGKYSFINKNLVNETGKIFSNIEEAMNFNKDYPYNLYNLNRENIDTFIDTNYTDYDEELENIDDDIEDKVRESLIEYSDELMREYDFGDKFDYVGYFVEGIANADKNGRYGYIDTNGNIVIDFKYDNCQSFNELGTAEVEMEGEQFYIDRQGRELFVPSRDLIPIFEEMEQSKKLNIDTDIIEKLSKMNKLEIKYMLMYTENEIMVWLLYALKNIGKREKKSKKYNAIIESILDQCSGRLRKHYEEEFKEFNRVEFIMFEGNIKNRLRILIEKKVPYEIKQSKEEEKTSRRERRKKETLDDSYYISSIVDTYKFRAVNEGDYKDKYIKYNDMFDYLRERIKKNGVLEIENDVESIKEKEVKYNILDYIDGNHHRSRTLITKENKRIYLNILIDDIKKKYEILKLMMLTLEYGVMYRFERSIALLFGDEFDYKKEFNEISKKVVNEEILWNISGFKIMYNPSELSGILNEIFKTKKLEELTVTETLMFSVLYMSSIGFLNEYKPTIFQEKSSVLLKKFYKIIDENVKTDKFEWYLKDLRKERVSPQKLDKAMLQEIDESKKLFFWAMKKIRIMIKE